MSRLTGALRAFESREPEKALTLALDVWRQVPDPRLGALIVSLGELVATRVRDEEWEDAARARRPEQLTGLLASIQDTSRVMKGRVLLLEQWPADPRLDRWVVRQYEKPPFTSTGSGPFWTALKKLTTRVSDPVARSTLSTLSSSRLENVKLGPPPATTALGADELDDLTAFEAALARRATPSTSQRTAADLLADALANPSNLTVRHVLMDALLEQGDARGQLLALQLKEGPLSAAEKKREKALIAEHRDELLGPLAPALKPTSRFARGFLVHADVRAAMSGAVEQAIAEAKGHALWRTVESFTGDGRLLIGADFPVLREVETWRVSVEQLLRFPTLESIAMRLTPDDLNVLTTPGHFPLLHSLKPDLEPAMLAPFEAWARTRSWQSLRFTIPARDLAPYCQFLSRPLALATGHLALEVLQSDFARSTLEVDQAGGKTQVTLTLELPQTAHVQWSERLVADGLALLEAVAARPGLEVELKARNAREAATAPLRARVTAMGGR